MSHMAINVLTINLRLSDTTQISAFSGRITWSCCQDGVQEFRP